MITPLTSTLLSSVSSHLVNISGNQSLSEIRKAMETATHYLVTGDSRRDNSYNDMVSLYIPNMLGKAGITTIDNAVSGLIMTEWANGTGSATYAEAISSIPNDGSTTLWEFSGGINDIDAGATQTVEELSQGIFPGIQAVIDAKPKITLFFVRPTPVASAARNVLLNLFYDALQKHFKKHIVDVYSVMVPLYDGTVPEAERVWYVDGTHPSRYGSFRIFNYTLSQILPDSLLDVITLDTSYYSGYEESLISTLSEAGIVSGQYWNSSGWRSSSASWASFNTVNITNGQLLRITHSGNRKDIRLFSTTPSNDPAGNRGVLANTAVTPDSITGNTYEYQISGNVISVGVNVSSVGAYSPSAGDKVEVFDIVKVKGTKDLTQVELNIGLPARNNWFNNVDT